MSWALLVSSASGEPRLDWEPLEPPTTERDAHSVAILSPASWLHCAVSVARNMRKLSRRSQVLASGGGDAAKVWETVNALGAKPGMINMGQGFPDFEGSAVARQHAVEAIRMGGAGMNQYSAQPGLLQLREAIAGFCERRHGAVYEPTTEIVVTAGAQEALAASFLAFLDAGDEIVLIEPFYPFMLGSVHLAGAVPRMVTLQPPDFGIPIADLRDAASSPKVKMIVLNTPHNPTGHVATAEEVNAIADICREKDLIAVADEVYEHCVFAGRAHHRLADLPGMRERTVSIGSGGKLFSVTGWRVARAAGPAELLRPLGQVHTHLTFSAPTPLQAGIAAALGADDGLHGVACLFAGNFELLSTALLSVPGVRRICAAQGGYFLVAETDRRDVDFCTMLAEEYQMACTPMSVFYVTPFAEDSPCNLVRFTICKSRELIERACKALAGKPIGEAATSAKRQRTA
ncbi:unnamed protein product [Prorocentrum cordatum]|uniref:Aminotransferase class I/classII large domain-containing protein n=1 Tax=Prorocentrum cordatum TaxID=2364126 RepID=A0ABN9TZ55_9DINO|nr:unnamed protein product [Polarella glacialis]